MPVSNVFSTLSKKSTTFFFNIIHTRGRAYFRSRRPRVEHEEIYNLVIIIYNEGSRRLFKYIKILITNYYLLSSSYNNFQCETTTGQVGLPIQRWAFQHETFEHVIALKSAPVYAQRLHTY